MFLSFKFYYFHFRLVKITSHKSTRMCIFLNPKNLQKVALGNSKCNFVNQIDELGVR
ncbi:MAG: hypothetical protein ACI9ZX_002867 [Algoriphagus sp.]|jgi:hypothetical protein